MLAQRAVADSPRWTRAVGDQTGRPHVKSRRTRKEIEEGGRSGALLARRAPTIKLWSLDARSGGQPRPLPLVEVWSRGGDEADGLLCLWSAYAENVFARQAQCNQPGCYSEREKQASLEGFMRWISGGLCH